MYVMTANVRRLECGPNAAALLHGRGTSVVRAKVQEQLSNQPVLRGEAPRLCTVQRSMDRTRMGNNVTVGCLLARPRDGVPAKIGNKICECFRAPGVGCNYRVTRGYQVATQCAGYVACAYERYSHRQISDLGWICERACIAKRRERADYSHRAFTTCAVSSLGKLKSSTSTLTRSF